MRRFWRVTFLAANGRKRHVWAVNYNDPGGTGLVTFTVVDREGDEAEPREVVFASHKDVVRLRPAKHNRTYATLEVVDAERPWTESERQGVGRRYWFDTEAAAELFALGREKAHFVTREGRTVWVSQAKRARAVSNRTNRSKARRQAMRRVHATLAGKDPE